jgi:hypothetical protein
VVEEACLPICSAVDADSAVVGELVGVAQQIQKRLPQAHESVWRLR